MQVSSAAATPVPRPGYRMDSVGTMTTGIGFTHSEIQIERPRTFDDRGRDDAPEFGSYDEALAAATAASAGDAPAKIIRTVGSHSAVYDAYELGWLDRTLGRTVGSPLHIDADDAEHIDLGSLKRSNIDALVDDAVVVRSPRVSDLESLITTVVGAAMLP